MAAGAILSLGRALMVLSGASLLVGGAKGIAALFGAVGGATAGTAINTAAAGAKAASAVKPGAIPLSAKFAAEWDKVSRVGKIAAVLQTISGLYDAVKNSSPEGMKENVEGARSFADSVTRFLFGDEIANRPDMPAKSKYEYPDWVKNWNAFVTENGRAVSLAVQSALASTPRTPVGVTSQLAIQSSQFPGKTKDDLDIGRPKTVSIDAASISAMVQPSGVQQVHVVNQGKRRSDRTFRISA